jgi:cytochrome c1
MRLMVRYYIEPKRGVPNPVPDGELATDLSIARDLLEQPPALSAGDPWDAPAAVAAAALEGHLLRNADVPEEGLTFAAETLLRVGEGEASPRQFEFEETYFEQAADRSAARAVPLLLLPAAARVRAAVDGADGSGALERAVSSGINLAHAIANEVRLHLARGLDHVWDVPCTDGTCHHEVALRLVVETMRDCVLGEWDSESGQRRLLKLEDPVGDSLAGIGDSAILFSRLDAAIRALAPATMANICVSARARDLLMVLLRAQRRALLAYEHDMDSRGSHALVSARALLTIGAEGDNVPIYEHIDAYADNSTLLGAVLRALSAAAEEESSRAATARRIWPDVIKHVLGFGESGHTPFLGRHYDDMSLAALMPNAAFEVAYLYQEVKDTPIGWWDPVAWQAEIDAWLPIAAGNATCVDQFISFLGGLAPSEQVRIGLRRIATLVLADPAQVARRSFLLSTWLIEIRSAGVDLGVSAEWQRVVDALVVAGASRLAPYSE